MDLDKNKIVDEGKKEGIIHVLDASYGNIVSNEKKYIFTMEDVNSQDVYNLHVGDSVSFIGEHLKDDEDDITPSAKYVKKIK